MCKLHYRLLSPHPDASLFNRGLWPKLNKKHFVRWFAFSFLIPAMPEILPEHVSRYWRLVSSGCFVVVTSNQPASSQSCDTSGPWQSDTIIVPCDNTLPWRPRSALTTMAQPTVQLAQVCLVQSASRFDRSSYDIDSTVVFSLSLSLVFFFFFFFFLSLFLFFFQTGFSLSLFFLSGVGGLNQINICKSPTVSRKANSLKNLPFFKILFYFRSY